jgi:hypothetical protein
MLTISEARTPDYARHCARSFFRTVVAARNTARPGRGEADSLMDIEEIRH